MRWTIVLIVMVLAGFSADADAQVHRSPTGMGSALIVPYWTAAGGNDTLVSIRNDSDRATVAKLHWLDDEGQLLQSFNLYLNPRSVWAAGIANFANGPGVTLNGNGCVLPSSLATEFESSYSIMPLASPRGSLEIIEMASSIHSSSGLRRWMDCEVLAEWFEPDGVWIDDTNQGLTAPAHRLSASVTIVDVAKGGMNTVAATALTGFSDLAQHSTPDAAIPDLSHAFDSEAPEGGVRSLVCPDSGCRTDEWAEPISAVAAALMTTSLLTDYTIDPGLAAEFEWMIHRPLKRYEVTQGGFEIGSAPTILVHGRNGFPRINLSPGEICAGVPPSPPPMMPVCGGWEFPLDSGIVQHSMPFNATFEGPDTVIQSFILGHPVEVWPAFSLGNWASRDEFTEGTAELSLGYHDQPLIAADGTAFLGEPVIGFGIQQFTNGTLVDGGGQNVLANYRGTEIPRRMLVLEPAN